MLSATRCKIKEHRMSALLCKTGYIFNEMETARHSLSASFSLPPLPSPRYT